MVKNAKPKKQAKTKALQSTSGKLKNIWRKNWQAILIAVVFVGILGFVGINQLIIYNQKQQFKAAEESLDSLYAEIVSKVGQPTSSNKDKSCGYANTKIGEGQLGCGGTFFLTYRVKDANEANSVKDNVIKTIKNSVELSFMRNAQFNDTASTLPGENAAGDIKSHDGISYSFEIDYIINKGSKEVSVDIGFGGHPLKAVYPVKD